MGTLSDACRRLASEEDGATAIEYGLIAGMMAVVVIGIAATGGALDGIYKAISAVSAALT